MAKLSDARRAALGLVSRRRRNSGRIRDMAREDKAMRALGGADKALAFRLALGATAATAQLDGLIDARLRKPSALEPRVRDALRISAFELCYLSTPTGVAVSQGVELVRSVSPRATGLANAVLRRLADEGRAEVSAARERLANGAAHVDDLALVSGLPTWLVERVVADRGTEYAKSFCLAQLEPPPVYVAVNEGLCSVDEARTRLAAAGVDVSAAGPIAGCLVLSGASALAESDMIARAELVVADLAAQVVCRLAAPAEPSELLEIGQGRGTKSILLVAGAGVVHPTLVVGVESVPYKVHVARKRMDSAGLADVVRCVELDATLLAGADVPPELDRQFSTVLLDAPCSGTGTMRRHPEIASSLAPADVEGLAELQLRLLKAAASRVAPGGALVYATCSVLRQEDEDVVDAFLASPEGEGFCLQAVGEAPACVQDEQLAQLVSARHTSAGHFLSMPTSGAEDGHFCARLIKA